MRVPVSGEMRMPQTKTWLTFGGVFFCLRLLFFLRLLVLRQEKGVRSMEAQSGVGGLIEDEQPVALLVQAGIKDDIGEAFEGEPVA